MVEKPLPEFLPNNLNESLAKTDVAKFPHAFLADGSS